MRKNLIDATLDVDVSKLRKLKFAILAQFLVLARKILSSTKPANPIGGADGDRDARYARRARRRAHNAQFHPQLASENLIRLRRARPFRHAHRVALATTLLALVAWVALPNTTPAVVLQIIAGTALLLRLARWRGSRTGAEPLLFVLHLGYGWLSFGLLFMGANEFLQVTDATTSLHTLPAGEIGIMTLAVMTRATRGHTGHPLVADRGTVAIYVVVTLAPILRVGAPFTGDHYFVALSAAAGLWSLAYGLFALLYFEVLTGPRARADS